MSIIITGATGQLGVTLQNAFGKELQGMPIYAFSREQLDITNNQQIRSVLAEYQPKWVINPAAFTSADAAESRQEEAFTINVNGPRYLAEECERINATLLHFSTDYVFPGDQTIPYKESDRCDPKSTYGETKWLGEQAIITSMENYIILRISWVFSQHNNNFLKTILRLLKERESLRVVQDQQGCPTYTYHIANIVKQIIESNKPLRGIFHYSDQPITTWYDFACYIQDQLVNQYHFERKAIFPITTEEYPTPAIRPKYSALDSNKLLQLLNIPAYSWKDGVKETLGALLS